MVAAAYRLLRNGADGGFYPHPASGHLLPAREKAKLFNGRLNRRWGDDKKFLWLPNSC